VTGVAKRLKKRTIVPNKPSRVFQNAEPFPGAVQVRVQNAKKNRTPIGLLFFWEEAMRHSVCAMVEMMPEVERPFIKRDPHDFFDEFTADNGIGGPIAALHQNVRSEKTNESTGGLIRKPGHKIHGF
jgi:hypothetical protein